VERIERRRGEEMRGGDGWKVLEERRGN